MIIVRLEGGLGNQLFQYAHAIAFQELRGGRLIADTRRIDKDPMLRQMLDRIVPLPRARWTDWATLFLLRSYAGGCIRIARLLFGPSRKAAHVLARLGVFHSFDARFVDFGKVSVPFAYLHGNFMSEKYFPDSRALLLSLIDVEKPLGVKARGLAQRIKSSAAVAVHVRRGDYLDDHWRDKLHICNDDYYRRAIAKILEHVENPEFYIFTTGREDADWVRSNYRFLPQGAIFVDYTMADIEHFSLMSMCSHFVISNSTFSWWASYLSRSDNRLTVAPTPWNRHAWDMTDIYLPDWYLVEVDVAKMDD